MSRGAFISIEGGEGTGKSTQVRALADALEASGRAVQRTREPGGSAGAEAIRELLLSGGVGRWRPYSELFLHAAARREHVEATIAPALDAGTSVVSDRFADSTTAYQGYGHGLALSDIATINALACGGWWPDLTLILDSDPETGLARARGRASPATRYERMDDGFHTRVRDGFREIAAAAPERCRVIDATRPAAAVTDAVLAATSDRFGVALRPRPG